MHSLKQGILDAFKMVREHSTSGLVGTVFASQMASIDAVLKDPVSTELSKKKALQLKAKLHRQLLHHINGLIQEDILTVVRLEGKGEKVFALSIQSDEELIIKSKRQRIIVQSAPDTPLERYEREGVLYKYEPSSWAERLNAVLLESLHPGSLGALEQVARDVFPHVNDVVGFNDFEKVIQTYPLDDCMRFVDRIAKEAADYNKRICLIIDVSNIMSDERIEQFFLLLTKHTLASVLCVFDVTSKEMVLHHDLFEKLVVLHAKYHLKFNIKNDDLHHAPYIVGKAGPYTISPSDWSTYVARNHAGSMGLCLCQSSAVFDLARYFELQKSAATFLEMTQAVSKSLFIVDTHLRKDHDEIFRHLARVPGYDAVDFFAHSSFFIRILNIHALPSGFPFDALIHLIESAKAASAQLAHVQETIYLSCGMPLRFDVGFSQAYRRFNNNPSLFEEYERIVIRNGTDLYGKDMRARLKCEETLASLMSGGFETRFFREGNAQPAEVIGECSLIMNTYKLPFFCYKFEIKEGTSVPLTSFFAESDSEEL